MHEKEDLKLFNGMSHSSLFAGCTASCMCGRSSMAYAPSLRNKRTSQCVERKGNGAWCRALKGEERCLAV
eukprot:scaffold97618_cov21-Tisochrysis_lutea.AAC.1